MIETVSSEPPVAIATANATAEWRRHSNRAIVPSTSGRQHGHAPGPRDAAEEVVERRGAVVHEPSVDPGVERGDAVALAHAVEQRHEREAEGGDADGGDRDHEHDGGGEPTAVGDPLQRSSGAALAEAADESRPRHHPDDPNRPGPGCWS